MKFFFFGLFLLLIIVVSSTFFVVSQSQAKEALSLSVSQTASEGSVLGAATYQSDTSVTVSASENDPLAALRAIPQASTFVSLLDETGVTAELSPAGTYTFFVPTNAAFAASPLGPLSSLSFAQQKRLAEFHIVSGKMMSLDAVKSGYMTMSSRDDLNLNVFDTPNVESNSHVVATYRVSDGIIYLIDIVLQPPVVRPYPF
jgi:uncharacterized surface protein with fasciclin (FAS1) repeats